MSPPPSTSSKTLNNSSSSSSSQPVTRIACFRFKASTTPSQISDRTASFLRLYAAHSDLLLQPPKGGRPLHTPLELTDVKREAGWDAGFVVMFKSDEARKEFDGGEGHERLKNETDKLLDQVFVYDFVEQENLGW